MSALNDDIKQYPSAFVEEIIGVEPFDYQKEFIDSEERHSIIASGRQIGKSRMCAWIALHHAITNAYSTVLITAPSLRQSGNLFDQLYTEIDKSALSNSEWGIERDTQTVIEFDNGSEINCLPTGRNGDKIRSFTADLVIVDEAAFINKASIFEDILEPMLFVTKGSMVLASTPWGKSGYFYKKFQEAKSNSKWHSSQLSSYANPLIDEDDLDDFKIGKTEAQIDREVRGQFTEDVDQFFPTDNIKACMPGSQPKQHADKAWLGADIAGSGSDRTIFYGVDEQGEVFLNDEVHPDMGVIEAAEYISSLDNMYHFEGINIDRTAIGEGTLESLMKNPALDRRVTPVYFSLQKKQQLYQRLKAAIESEYIHLPYDKDLKLELEAITSDKTQNGALKLYPRNSSDGGTAHDDHVDALALAVWGLPEFNSTASGSKRAVTGSMRGSSSGTVPGMDRLHSVGPDGIQSRFKDKQKRDSS